MNHNAPVTSDAPSSVALPLVIYLPRIHAAVTYRPWLISASGRTVLEVLISYAQRVYGSQGLTILCHEEEPPIIRRYVEELGATLLISSSPTVCGAYSHILDSVRAENVVVARIELLFAPPDVLRQAAECHIRNRNDVTLALGLPLLVAPGVYSTRALRFLSMMQESLPAPIDPSIFFPFVVRNSGLRGASDGLNLQIGSVSLHECCPNAHGLEVSDDINIAAHPAIGRECAELLALRGSEVNRNPWLAIETWRTPSFEASRQARHRDSSTRGEKDAVAWHRPERRRILFASHASGYSGAEVSLCQLIGNLNGTRYEAHGLVALDGHFSSELRGMCESVHVPNRAFDAYTLENFAYCRSVLDDIKPALVHSNGYLGTAMLSALAATGVPLVQHVRVAQVDTLRSELLHADGIIAISQFIKRRLLTLGLPDDSVAIIDNPVDVDQVAVALCDRMALRREMGVPEDALVLSMVARFAPYKRHDLLIEALRRCRQKLRSPVRVFLVGEVDDGAYYLAMKQLIDQSGLSEAITHIRFTPQLLKYLTVADMLVLCSTDEPLGRCILEDMVAGVPVISSDSGGPREFIENRVSGLLFTSGNADSLADAIVTLSTDRDLGRSMANEALSMVRRRFSSSRHAAAVVRLYETILSSI